MKNATDIHSHTEPRPLRTPEYAAATWGVSISTLYRMVRDGRAHAHRVGKNLRFSDAEIERVLREAHSEAQAAA